MILYKMAEDFGTPLGQNRGVIGYSNGNNRRYKVAEERINGQFTGIKYQCVEYARRWLILVKGLTFKSVLCACDIWALDHVYRVEDQQKVNLMKVPNGSPVFPQVGALLIYKRRFSLPFGHIAVITEIDPEGKYIRIAEQNEEDRLWPGDYARQLLLENVNGNHFIRDKYSLYGWMVYENYPNLPQESSGCSIF
jgi:hypothetical protein